jgi:lipoprotein
MKRILLLALVGVAVLFVGCKDPHERDITTTTVYYDAVLTISNQTSTDFSSVMYNGNKKISGSTTVAGKTTEYGTELEKGHTWKAMQRETPCSSYIYFTVGSLKARTDELITLEKGDNKIFTFTDNTLVVKDGEKKAIPMSEARTAATVLIIQNNTSQAISAVTYAGKHPETVKDSSPTPPYLIKSGEQASIPLDDACSAALYFDIRNYHLKTADKVSIGKGERKLYSIDGNIRVIQEGTSFSRDLNWFLN